MRHALHVFGLATMLALSTSACVGRVRAEPASPDVQLTAESVPVEIETYPSTSYDGHAVYLWNERWYYRDGPRWTYYRNEPEVLQRHRETLRRPPPPPRPRAPEPEHRSAPPDQGHHDDRRDEQHGDDRR